MKGRYQLGDSVEYRVQIRHPDGLEENVPVAKSPRKRGTRRDAYRIFRQFVKMSEKRNDGATVHIQVRVITPWEDDSSRQAHSPGLDPMLRKRS
jgi:hypothetical protein